MNDHEISPEQEKEQLLTAYALGELENETAEQVKKDLLNDPAHRKYVEEIQLFARQIENELKAETDLVGGLREDQLTAIEEELRVTEGSSSSRPEEENKIVSFPRMMSYGLLALAACATLLVVVLGMEQVGGNAFRVAGGRSVVPVGTQDLLPYAKEVDKPLEVAFVPDESTASEPAPSLSLPAPSESVESDATVDALVPLNMPSAPPRLGASGGATSPVTSPMPSPKPVTSAPVANRLETIAEGKKSYADSSSAVVEGTASGTGSGRGSRTTFFGSVTKSSGSSSRVVMTQPSLAAAAPTFTGGNESYDKTAETAFVSPTQNPLSTFGLDVDTASYSNIRRFIQHSELPPAEAVRVEELVNYFSYDYPKPQTEHPFSLSVEITEAPWAASHLIARIGLRGIDVPQENRPAANLVFLVDVSGSMNDPAKLPLVQQCFRLLTRQLKESDRVAIVTYAGESRVALPSTSVEQRDKILDAIDGLNAGGSTNGQGGITEAYRQAKDHFIKGGINRVILCTDGDFNVGVSRPGDLEKLITEKAKTGVFLNVYGFGMGNLKDANLEKLANRGNGSYGYIDSPEEARHTFVQNLSGSLVTIAKDVKVQVEFNPEVVAQYRLIGYDQRRLAAKDFNNDKKDSGEIGAGHTVTALYEIIPAGKEEADGVDPLRYQKASPQTARLASGEEMMTVKLRYKKPDAETSIRLDLPVANKFVPLAKASADTRFATAVAAYALVLKKSEFKGQATYKMAEKLASTAAAGDAKRLEFLELVRATRKLDPSADVIGSLGGFESPLAEFVPSQRMDELPNASQKHLN